MTGILGKFHVEHGVHGARVVKRLLELNRRGSLFEGWPSGKDNVLDA